MVGNCEELIDYPYEVAIKISTSPEIIQLLLDNPTANPEDYNLINTQIFSDDYIPETLNEVQKFICVDADIPKVTNSTTKDVEVTIYVFMHHDCMKLDNLIWKERRGKGNRRDHLCNEITKLLNGSSEFGIGKLELTSTMRFRPAKDYSGRMMKFKAKSFNQSR